MQQAIPRDIIQKVRYIEIKTRKVVDSILSGGYHSAFKGKGMEFSDVRPYVPGDDIRSIDWNVTARCGSPYVKVYHEEREMTVFLFIDASASLRFGSRYTSKREVAAELAAVIAFSAIKNNDNVGLVLFTTDCEHYIPPKKGRKHGLRVIREVLFHQPAGKGTAIGAAIRRMSKVIRKKSLIFILSDFLDEDWYQAISILGKKHDVIPLVFSDPLECDIPESGLIHFYDAETGQGLLLDSSCHSFRELFRKSAEQRQSSLQSLFHSIGIDPIYIQSGQPYIQPLVQYFRMREKRRSR